MKNDLFSIGQVTIHGYGLMIAVGILAAYLTAVYRARKRMLDPEPVYILAILAVAGGMLGAKLLYIMTQIGEVLSHPESIFSLSDGFVVYGGIIGGILTGFLYCRKKKLDFLKYFDLVIPSVALAQGFGRIGCFLAGCCYGMKTTGPLWIVFHESDYAPNGVRLVPTQLVSSGLDFINFIVLVFLSRKTKADGQVAGFYLIFYSAGRFVLEFFRGDLIRGSVGGLSTSQFISIFMFAAGCAIVLLRSLGAGGMGKRIRSLSRTFFVD